MSINPTVKIDPDDIVRYLLYQQFYYGEDQIYGRTKDRSEHINRAGEAIEAFYSLINDPIYLIDEEKPIQYLKFFDENVHIIPLEDIMNKYRDYKDLMGKNMERHMTITVIVGESLTEIQSKCFEASIVKLTEFIMEKRSLLPNKKAEIVKRIKSLYGESSPNIGMIYGLSFMEFIAKKVGFKNIEIKCKELLAKYYDLISEEIQ